MRFYLFWINVILALTIKLEELDPIRVSPVVAFNCPIKFLENLIPSVNHTLSARGRCILLKLSRCCTVHVTGSDGELDSDWCFSVEQRLGYHYLVGVGA